MKVLLLANQPQKTTRLKLMAESLVMLGYQVIIPDFPTRNWIAISKLYQEIIIRERPDVIHLFNVPDIIYRNIPNLKGRFYRTLIYDYRSPWVVELEMNLGPPAQYFAERYEKLLAESADIITTVNSPLQKKVRSYLPDKGREIHIIPNYPAREFGRDLKNQQNSEVLGSRPILFVGRVCVQEGIKNLLKVAAELPNLHFEVVGEGPFLSWYKFLKPNNVTFLGWQEHKKVAQYIAGASVCLIPREDNPLTPYSTDRSIWKLNEYLNLGKIVVASGITNEEVRKNLYIVNQDSLAHEIERRAGMSAASLEPNDYRFWETNNSVIKKIYDSLS